MLPSGSVGQPSISHFDKGNDLYKWCTQKSDGGSYCLGYISAAVDMIFLYQDTAVAAKQTCIPAGVTQNQARDIVVKYMNDFPENRHYVAASVVLAALTRSFPCKK